MLGRCSVLQGTTWLPGTVTRATLRSLTVTLSPSSSPTVGGDSSPDSVIVGNPPSGASFRYEEEPTVAAPGPSRKAGVGQAKRLRIAAGQRVEVRFDGDPGAGKSRGRGADRWYSGCVTTLDSESGVHVRYDKDDRGRSYEGWLDWDDVEPSDGTAGRLRIEEGGGGGDLKEGREGWVLDGITYFQGDRVEVFFWEKKSKKGNWYAGWITKLDDLKGIFVQFDDGDEQWIDWQDLKKEGVDLLRILADNLDSSVPTVSTNSTATAAAASSSSSSRAASSSSSSKTSRSATSKLQNSAPEVKTGPSSSSSSSKKGSDSSSQYEVGRKVDVYWETENAWFPGTIDSTSDTRGVHVAFDDGDDDWLTWEELKEEGLKLCRPSVLKRKPEIVKLEYAVGDEVDVYWETDDSWYVGTVMELNKTWGARLRYADNNESWVSWAELDPTGRKSRGKKKARNTSRSNVAAVPQTAHEQPCSCEHSGCNFQARNTAELDAHVEQEHPSSRSSRQWLTCGMTGCTFKTKIRETLISHEVKWGHETK